MTMKLMILFIGCLIILSRNTLADDGMWLPHQMAALGLESAGLKMDPQTLYRSDGSGIMNAIVNLGGGTGEFVSREGLILTNHHVAFRAIQSSSTPEKDYLENGFIAWKRSEEIPAPGYYADVLLAYEEVTGQITKALDKDLRGEQKYHALHRIMNFLAAEAEKDGPDLICKVVPMYSGNMYYLFRFKRIRDIRIVYAPPRDLGNFGGETDNWIWPRHTCDFSFLRAYVSPENIGTEYNPENVPYKPASVLKISLDGLKEGEFTFVMGYPARTYRNYTTEELKYDMERMHRNLQLRSRIIGFLDKECANSKAVEIKYASRLKSLNNGLKNYTEKLYWFDKSDIISRKEERERELKAWIAEDENRRMKYQGVLERLNQVSAKAAVFDHKKEVLEQLVNRNYGPALLRQAYLISRNAIQKTLPDHDRLSYYQDKNHSILVSQITLAERGYALETDRDFFSYTVRDLLNSAQLPALFKTEFSDTGDAVLAQEVSELYRNTRLNDPEYRLQLLENRPEQLWNIDDPLLRLGIQLAAVLDSLDEQEHALKQDQEDARAAYKSALLEMYDGKIAPDANGTLRFTYGPVKGYQPRDAVLYLPFTTLSGVIEKDRGVFPFQVPDRLKTLYRTQDYGRYRDNSINDVVTCFLNTTNVTGGNSGSPTLNAEGEQVGIIFDMTSESVTGDYFVIPSLQRTISVDIRYVLFITDRFSGATHIIEELRLD